MKKVLKLLAALIVLASLTGCSIKNEAYKNKTAQEFIEIMEEIKEDLPEDCEFDYEVKNTLIKDKAIVSMELTYNDHTLEMTMTFDSWDSIEQLDSMDEQEMMDNGYLDVEIDGVKYTNSDAVEALMDVYFSEVY